MDDNIITVDWLNSHGYKLDRYIGYVKDIGGEHGTKIIVGSFPFNVDMVSIRVDGVTIGTNVRTLSALKTLEQMLVGAPVDYDVQYANAGG